MGTFKNMFVLCSNLSIMEPCRCVDGVVWLFRCVDQDQDGNCSQSRDGTFYADDLVFSYTNCYVLVTLLDNTQYLEFEIEHKIEKFAFQSAHY